MCLWHKQTVYGMKAVMQSTNATATLPDWSLRNKIPSVPLLWKFSVCVDMQYSAPSCRRTWWQRQKLRDQSLKSGSRVSQEAGTKNNTWLKYLPSSRNKQQSAANCDIFTKTGDWEEASGIDFIIMAQIHNLCHVCHLKFGYCFSCFAVLAAVLYYSKFHRI